MPSPLAQAGALAEPSSFAALYTNRLFTGKWTNRNFLRDAATPFLYEKFYSASRQDSIIGGVNRELSAKLTLIRRPGHTVYNSQNFPPIDRFYEFRKFSTSAEQIRVMADTAATVYDATGPNTKNAIMTKSAGAGRTSFQSVGNTLYMGNGIDQKEWVQTTRVWTAGMQTQAGDILIDQNGNIQLAVGSFTVKAVSTSVLTDTLTVNLDPTDPNLPGNLNVLTFIGIQVDFQGFVAAAYLNGNNMGTRPQSTSTSVVGPFVHADYTTLADSGTITTGNGITGVNLPPFVNELGWVTVDGGAQWINKGPALRDWGGVGPTSAPTTSFSQKPNTFAIWKNSTYYHFDSFPMVNAANDIQVLTTGGLLTNAEPAWATDPGAVTNWGTATFTCLGPNNLQQRNTAYNVGDIVRYNGPFGVSSADFWFKCIEAGVTAPTGGDYGTWPTSNGAQVFDGSVIWESIGLPTGADTIAALGGIEITTDTEILDPNGFVQQVQGSTRANVSFGETGSTEPTFSQIVGNTTQDMDITWQNILNFFAAGTGAIQYFYSYEDSVNDEETNLSPASAPITSPLGALTTVQGLYSTNKKWDTVNLYRTVQNGSTPLFMGSIGNDVNGGTWSFEDDTDDSELNPQLAGPGADQNDPPAVGLTALTYHLGCIFGAVGNVIYYSRSPLSGSGSALSSFPPLQSFTAQSSVIRLWPTSIGLLVFTVSEVLIITGDNNTAPLVMQPFIGGLGMLSWDAFAVNGTTLYLYSTAFSVISLDPGAGLVDVGFPIAGELVAGYSPSASYMTFHQGSSNDAALYLADGATKWERLSAITAPESGFAWSTTAVIEGGMQCVKSVETSPGVKQLLLGPAGPAPGPILFRNVATNQDNGVSYPSNVVFGNIVIAQPGQIGGLQFVTLESPRLGKRPTMGLLLGELSGTFEMLRRTRQDPPLLPPSLTLFSDRYSVGQRQKPSWCRHFQMSIDWGVQNVPDELLSFTVFGQLRSEYKDS